jgi:hypothetical protein
LNFHFLVPGFHFLPLGFEFLALRFQFFARTESPDAATKKVPKKGA